MATFFYRAQSNASLSKLHHANPLVEVEKFNVIRGGDAIELRKSIVSAIQSNKKHVDAPSNSESSSDSSSDSCSESSSDSEPNINGSKEQSSTNAETMVSKMKSLKPKKRSTLRHVQDVIKQSAFGRFIACKDLTSDDLDDSVNQMALVCAVILTIPYQVGQTVGPSYFDWLKGELEKCPKSRAGGYDFGIAMSAFREYMLCCMFSTMCGMILSTFYFLFKRSLPDLNDHNRYMRKCRYITIYIFICTSFGIISLIMLSNFLIEWFVVPTDALCTDTDQAVMLVGFGMLVAFLVFLLSIYLVF